MPHITTASWILHTDSNRTYAILSAPRWNISVPDGPEKDFMNLLQMRYHCSIVLEEMVNNHFLCSLSKTVMILGAHALYHIFFHIILCMTLQYSCYSNPMEESEILPFALFQSPDKPTEIILMAPLGFRWNQSKEQGCDTDAASPVLLYTRYLYLPWQTHSPEHQWSHSKQGSPNLREDLLFQGMWEDDVQHSTDENKPSKNKSMRLDTLMLTLLIEYLAQTMQNRLNYCILYDCVSCVYVTLLNFYR